MRARSQESLAARNALLEKYMAMQELQASFSASSSRGRSELHVWSTSPSMITPEGIAKQGLSMMPYDRSTCLCGRLLQK